MGTERTFLSHNRVVDFWPQWHRQIRFCTQCYPLHCPKQFGGLEGRWTPEELLLVAIASCFTTTLRTLAKNSAVDFTDAEVEASATIRKEVSGYSFSEIVLRPMMKISRMKEREGAIELLKRTEKLCLVSRTLGVELRLEPQIEVVEVVPV